jgi:hypothetical protein
VFWILGAPGVGKSAFAAHLAHFYGRGTIIAVQFCDWQKSDHRDPRSIVRTLAFQIASQLPDYRKLLLASPEISELDKKDSSELFDFLLAAPLRLTIDGKRERYLIIIDALDEAGVDGRNELVEMLAKNAARLPDWIGLVVTSRPESDVVAPLQGLNPFVLDTAAESNRIDIRDYLRRELVSQLQNRPSADLLLEQIIEKSGGVFLYVERFCDDVQRGQLSLERPDQFPQGLGESYFQYFQRQVPDLEKFRRDVRSVLRAIIAAREPLPVEILQRLFNWQDEELRDFTRTLGSLFPVTKDGDHEVIKPYHKSVAEWLADDARAGAYFVSVQEGHRYLATQLRKFLNGTGHIGIFARTNLPIHLALSADRTQFINSLSDTSFLKELRWQLPNALLEAALAGWPPNERAVLAKVPTAFAVCAYGLSLRASGFTYIHEDTIEAVRRGESVTRHDGRPIKLTEIEPDNDRMYDFIYACRKMLRCAYDFSTRVEIAGSRNWLTSFLGGYTNLIGELEVISKYYDRTHFGPSLRASETMFMWECLLSGDADKAAHARSVY